MGHHVVNSASHPTLLFSFCHGPDFNQGKVAIRLRIPGRTHTDKMASQVQSAKNWDIAFRVSWFCQPGILIIFDGSNVLACGRTRVPFCQFGNGREISATRGDASQGAVGEN